MVKEIGPAKLPYAIDTPIPPASPPQQDLPSQGKEVKPAALRYAVDSEGLSFTGRKKGLTRAAAQTAPAARSEKKAEIKPPQSSFRIPRLSKAKRGRDLMKKKVVTLKVEDLLRAGRSHFEIPKSQQKASVIKPRPRRG